MADESSHLSADVRLSVLAAISDADRLGRVTEALEGPSIVVLEVGGVDAAISVALDIDADLLLTDDVAADGTLGGSLQILLDSGTPPVVVIAESEMAGVAALEAGAADYVVEPFLDRELRARALLRSVRSSEVVLDCGDLQIDRVARRVIVRGKEVELTKREYDLLVFLARRPQRVFSRDELLEAVWGVASTCQDPDTVTEHVYRLRQKIEQDPRRPQWLITVRGAGYRFDG